MPPVGSRKKKFEQEMRRVQNRNFFAALVLLVAIVASVFLIRWLWMSSKPKLFVSINRVDHSGTREIPFSENSCEILKTSFEQHLACEVADIQELDEANSNLKLDPGINESDVLIVYLNGHVVEKIGDDGPNIYWIAPESEMSKESERELSELLKSADASPAKTKIFLLDAGRYSWSPSFPGRNPNHFQSVLEHKLKENAWKLSDDFWVITSHSDCEISNVSTPLKSSLFAKAVAESLKSLSGEREEELQVTGLFEEIRKTTESYARNFNNKSLQNPVLMRPGIGIVESSLTGITSPDLEPIRVAWNKPPAEQTPEADKEPRVASFQWDNFARSPDKYSNWLSDTANYASLPNQTIRGVERFIEFGDYSDTWTGQERQTFDDYADLLNRSNKASSSEPTRFDPAKLKDKQEKVDAFRKSLLEFSLLTRFRNQMRFWDDNAYKDVRDTPFPPRLADPIKLTDQQLQVPETITPELEDWLKRFHDFKIGNEKLFETVERKLAQSDQLTLTPMQAELLGVLSQRYLPLLNPKSAEDKTGKSDAVPGDFKITMEVVEKTSRLNPDGQPTELDPNAGYKLLVNNSIGEVENHRGVYAELVSDTSLRYVLASTGSEFESAEVEAGAATRTGIVANVSWEKIDPSITVSPKSREPVLMVNPHELIPVQFEIETLAVDDVNLQIADSPAKKLEGLDFGFNPDFDKKNTPKLVAAGDPFRKHATVNIYFAHPDLEPKDIGSSFDFQVTATDPNNSANTTTRAFSIEITSDATFLLKSERVLANQNGESQARLFRWGKTLPNDWSPLVIHTLANVKSRFKLSLQNNSNHSRSFIVKLFKIRKFPNEIDVHRLRADRDDWEQTSNYVQWIGKQNLEPGDNFELIAQASVELPNPNDNKPIVFTIPPPTDPKAEKLESVEEELELGALIVFYSPDEPDKPEWFQSLMFEPHDSANVAAAGTNRLKIQPQIQAVFGDDIEELKKKSNLSSLVEENSAARLTIVSQRALDTNNEFEFALNLSNLLKEDELSPDNEPALLLLDVLGVPNYATYETNGRTIQETGLRQHLAGIHVIKMPEDWSCNPKSWSFASTNPMESPFRWLANDSNVLTDVFVRIPAKPDSPKDVEKDLVVEVFFPFINIDTLSTKSDDFWWRWNKADKTLFYPNHRQHFIEISPIGLTIWSDISSHKLTISDPANPANRGDQVLEFGRRNDVKTIGRWRFISESLRNDPVIKASRNDKVENTIADLKNVLIDVDVRPIKPTVSEDQITIQLNKKPVEKMRDFLESNRKGLGEYQFSLWELVSACGEEIPKEKMEMKIQVFVTDFFGEKTSKSTMVVVAPKPKAIPPPKPVTLVVNFTLAGKPADMHSFGVVVINQKTIPFDRTTELNGGSVKITGNTTSSRLTIEGLIPGSYDLTVKALVKPPSEGIYTGGTASKSRIKVAEGEPPLTLEFK